MSHLAPRRPGRGISLLLEVIFGIAVFAVALLVMFAVFPTAHRSLTQAKNYALANGIARELMEREKVRDYLYMADSPGPFLIPRSAIIDGVGTSTIFTANLQKTDLGTPSYDSARLAVRVSWAEGTPPMQLTREVVLETIVVRF